MAFLMYNLCYKGHLLALKVNIGFPLIPSQNPGYAWETHATTGQFIFGGNDSVPLTPYK